MDESAAPKPFAWQPLTFRGVAAFARGRASRLVTVQVIIAAISAATIVLLFQTGWNPSINAAIEQLPDKGQIWRGELHWFGAAPQRLGRGSFVSFVVDPDETGQLGQAGDVEWILTRTELHVRSLFGYLSFSYPRSEILPLNRQDLKPWWGAWRPALCAGIGVVALLALLSLWWSLAALYALPIRLIAFYADRTITLGGAWRLAGAAVLPGALLMDLAIVGYASNRLNLLQLLAAAAAHWMVGWIYVIAAPSRLPRRIAATQSSIRPANPFASPAGNAESAPKQGE